MSLRVTVVRSWPRDVWIMATRHDREEASGPVRRIRHIPDEASRAAREAQRHENNETQCGLPRAHARPRSEIIVMSALMISSTDPA